MLKDVTSTRAVDSAGQITESQWRYIDQRINWWLTERFTAMRAFPQFKIEPGKQTIEFWKWNEVGSPAITLTFEEEAKLQLTRTPTRLTLIGVRADFELNIRDAAADPKLANRQVDAGMRILQQFIDRIVYRGTDIRGKDDGNSSPTSIEGFFNTTGINSLGANGAGQGGDDDMTAYGDYPYTIKKMIVKLIEDNQYGDDGQYTLVVTPGCYAQMITNKSTTTGLTDLQEVLQIPASDAIVSSTSGLKPAIKQILTTPNLLNDSETNSTGEMLLIDPRPENIDVVVGRQPTRIALFNGGLNSRLNSQFAIITSLVPRVRRTTALCKTVTLTNNVLSS